ncbi:MAG: GNAT family N-acetyltransferase [Proteobacteria bacterium]|jgi:Acetyltransferases|nr:MAG: GNAT family N-acetyltransferase [Pseudomonadota bacterium]
MTNQDPKDIAGPSPTSASTARNSIDIIISKETPDQPEIAAFLAASDAYAQCLYPPESNHLVGLETLMAPDAAFFVARRAGIALGCGALIAMDGGWGEIKRMWVDPEARGQGIGLKLLEAIEAAARERSITVLRLETGIRQPEAINLYKKFGFVERGPFGDYQLDPLSIFMEKRLS